VRTIVVSLKGGGIVATHKIRYVEGSKGNVGNSMSTTFSCENGRLTVQWKNVSRSFKAKEGEAFLIKCYGSFPEVVPLIPPRDPIAKVAWESGFYRSKRYDTIEALQSMASEKSAWSQGRGMYLPSAKMYYGEKCAVCYNAVMEWQRGVPIGWWADKDCSAEDLESLIAEALDDCVYEGR